MKNGIRLHLKVAKDQKELVFKLNPYYECVTIKVSHNKFRKVTWHENNLKVVRTEPEVNNE